MKTLIFGARGNLGAQLVKQFAAAGQAVTAVDRAEIDATDFDAVRALVAETQPELIVNAIAWNDVDGAEDPAKRELCFRLNAELPGVLAAAAGAIGAKFLHYSSDYVFSGAAGEYDELATPDPVSVYGESKAAGERAVLAAGGQGYVARTSKLFGPPGPSELAKPSFVDVILKAAAERAVPTGRQASLKLVDEEVGCPTYTVDLAAASRELLTGDHAPGIYHLVSGGPGVTWYGFAEEFLGLKGIDTPREPVPMSAFPRPAARPASAVLRNTKFPPLPDRRDALRRYLQL